MRFHDFVHLRPVAGLAPPSHPRCRPSAGRSGRRWCRPRPEASIEAWVLLPKPNPAKPTSDADAAPKQCELRKDVQLKRVFSESRSAKLSCEDAQPWSKEGFLLFAPDKLPASPSAHTACSLAAHRKASAIPPRQASSGIQHRLTPYSASTYPGGVLVLTGPL